MKNVKDANGVKNIGFRRERVIYIRVLAALAEDPGSILSTHVWQHTTACISSSGKSSALSGLLVTYILVAFIYTDTHASTDTS